MPKIEFMTPVPPVPVSAAAPTVVMLVPDQKGGIRSLFEQMQNTVGASSRTALTFFDSNDDEKVVLARFPGRLNRFRTLLRDQRAALCHINLSTRGSTLRKLFYALLCVRAGVPYVIHLHGSGYNEFYARQRAPIKNVIQWLFRGADRVIVLGRVWRDFAVEAVGVPSERVVILPNAVKGPEGTINHPPEEPPHLLFLGRVGERKGVSELLDALADPELQALVWTATIAGDGDVDIYRARAAELGLDGRITFPGWVNGDQVAALLARANILVLPSHAENLPLSMLEGMGYSLCPVVTPVGAVEDVIRDGENGLLVGVGDAPSLASALVRVCKDGVMRQRFSEQARADFLASYDITDYRGRLEAIYLELIASERRE